MSNAFRPAGPAHAAIAGHRFGLGEPELSRVGSDPLAWLLAQVGPADPQLDAQGQARPGLAQALRIQVDARRSRDEAERKALRDLAQADLRARLATALRSQRPFAERLALFWANHFSVSNLKGSSQGLVGAFEREAIRPHIGGRFAVLLRAAATHPTMLRYLDNQASAGAQSPAVLRQRRRTQAEGAGPGAMAEAATPPRLGGLNENLGRELLELHTLGVAGGGGAYGPWGGYSQADVQALANLLTGWRGPRQDGGGDLFDPQLHQPGAKQLLGRRYVEGRDGLLAALDDLAAHPATARHLATKLARHLLADQPPPALVARMADRFTASGGELMVLYQTLLEAPEAWQAGAQKLKTPEEFVLSAGRVLALPASALLRAPDAGLTALGQRPQAATSAAGWADTAADWLGPEALWQRLNWSERVASLMGTRLDARALAETSLGPQLGEHSRQQIGRAADGPQAMALLLMSPEFQRR